MPPLRTDRPSGEAQKAPGCAVRLVRQRWISRASSDPSEIDPAFAQAFAFHFCMGASRGLVAGLVVEEDVPHGGKPAAADPRRQRRVELALDDETDLTQTEVEPFFSRRRCFCSAR